MTVDTGRMSRLAWLTGALVALLIAATPAQADPTDVLPDLDQIVPSDLSVKSTVAGEFRVFRLGFASASANIGPEPVTLHGFRRSRRSSTMQVDQFVTQTGTPAPRVVRGVGRMRYIVQHDHRHWHLIGFEHYELRAAGDDRPSVRHDRKSGFCLGDRFAIPHAKSIQNFNPTPLQGDTCGLGKPALLGIFAGISPGWADEYAAHIEGQYIDVTDAPTGTYVLVHTVNADHEIAESDYTNNASSVLFSMNWLNGRKRVPRIQILKRCPATASCAF
jgi:Lysyl oxidase